jgi:hypothetical protein
MLLGKWQVSNENLEQLYFLQHLFKENILFENEHFGLLV